MSEHLELETYNTRGSGIWFRARAGENLAAHDVVYMGADGLLYRANAGAAATMPAIGLAIYAVVQGLYGEFLSRGFIGDTAWAWIPGDILYVSAVAGQIIAVGPAIEQQVAIALSATQIYFDPAGIDTAGGVGAGGRTDFTYLVERDNGTYTVYDNQGTVVSGPGASAAVQINWALTNGGAGCLIVLEPDTTFVIDDPIFFTANGQTLQGAGFGSFLDGDTLATTEHGIVISGFDDCIIRDLSIQTQDGGTKTCHCIFIEDGADRFLIENVTIVDSDSDGIHVEGTTITEGHIHNCNILDTDDNGIQFDADNGNYMYYLKITECEIAGAGERGIRFADGNAHYEHCIIQDNTIHGSTLDGIYGYDLDYSTIGGNAIYDNDNHGIITNSGGRNSIVNNVVMANGFHGIYIVNSAYTVIDGNVLAWNDYATTNTYDGVHIVAGSDYITISNNQFNDNRRYGIYTGSPHTIIEGNGVALSQEHGIVIAAAECTCSGNNVSDNGQRTAGTYHGIFLTADAVRTVVIGNTCESPGDSQEDGIFVQSGAHFILIEGNYCYDGMGSGIALDDDNNNCHIQGNYLMANDDWGIEITTNNADRTFCKDNYFFGNTGGCIDDNGTDTATHEWNETVENPDANRGRHPVQQMLDGVETIVRTGFTCPMEFQELVTAQIVVIAGGTGNLRWNAFTDYGVICSGEAYNAHSDSVGATTTAATIDLLTCLDISAALDVAALTAGDRVGIEFFRDGDDGLDTIGAPVWVVQTRIRYV